MDKLEMYFWQITYYDDDIKVRSIKSLVACDINAAFSWCSDFIKSMKHINKIHCVAIGGEDAFTIERVTK